MAAGDLITVDGQVEIRGLLLGAGTDYPLVGRGPEWWSKPTVRAGDIARPASDGALATLDLSDAATVVLTVAILADDPADFAAKRTALATAWRTASTDVDLVFRWGGVKQLRRGRTRNMAVSAELVGVGDTAEAALQFVATDPLVYDADAQTVTTGVGDVTGGLAFPLAFPLAFGVATPGVVSAVNAGSAPAPWTATLTGPLTSPTVTHVGLGCTIAFAGLTLAAGEELVVDSAARTVLLGGASRYGSLTTREWFSLEPGANTVQLSASSGSGSLAVTWRNASL